MTKTNAKATKTVGEQTETDVQSVQKGTGDSGATQTTQAQPESSEKEFSVQSEQGGSEQTSGEGSTLVDTKTLQEKNGETGSDTTDQGTDDDENEDEETFREAKEAITGMVSEALESSGILDEPAEVTEKRNRIAKEVFAKNPQCDELYFTADLIPFFNKSDAFRHGSITLKNSVIVNIKRK